MVRIRVRRARKTRRVRRLLSIVRQTGKTKSIRRDRMLPARKPGKRRSITGRIYWETRRNRSDVNRKKRL